MNDPFRIYNGHALHVLRRPPAESVQCCITSPPYFGLRAYPVDPLVWGGDPACDHTWGPMGPPHHPGQVQDSKAVHAENAVGQNAGSGQFCETCGAWQGHLGLEPTPALFCAHLVEIFEGVHRVLAPDGIVFVNLGDSYARDARKGQHRPGNSGKEDYTRGGNGGLAYAVDLKEIGLPGKNLMGIPWRFAFAMQDAGWILRSEIIWEKPNVKPESVRDRPTRSHEHVFMFAKSPRYYYDHEAIKEPCVKGAAGSLLHTGKTAVHQLGRASTLPRVQSDTRNRRSVWSIPTAPNKTNHYAAYPEALAEPMVLAGTPPGGIVLDPFCGTATTGVVALKHGRKFIGIDLSLDYVEIAESRLAQVLADLSAHRK